MFTKAKKENIKVKMGIFGDSGSGKTYTALNIGTNLELPIALIDTENGSAKLYSDTFNFDICTLEDHSIPKLIETINYAQQNGYKTLIIDSLSASWYWELAEVDKAKTAFLGWANVRSLERDLINLIQKVDLNLIATMRLKTDYSLEKNQYGKTAPKKIKDSPVQTSNIEYEFYVFAQMIKDNHSLIFTKSRCPKLDKKTFIKPGKQIADILNNWLTVSEPKIEIPPLVSIGESPEELKQKIDKIQVKQPWKDWKNENDALAYAMNQLPEVTMNRITQEWNKLIPEVISNSFKYAMNIISDR